MTQAQHVQPEPTLTSWDIGQYSTPEGAKGVALQIHSPTGVTVFFLPADYAKAVAAQIIANANQASSGLILPVGVGL